MVIDYALLLVSDSGCFPPTHCGVTSLRCIMILHSDSMILTQTDDQIAVIGILKYSPNTTMLESTPFCPCGKVVGNQNIHAHFRYRKSVEVHTVALCIKHFTMVVMQNGNKIERSGGQRQIRGRRTLLEPWMLML